MGKPDSEPPVLREAIEILRKENFGQGSNPVEPFMRQVLIPALLSAPAVLRAVLTHRAIIGGTLGESAGFLFGVRGIGLVVGAVSGELLFKPETIHKARVIARRAFNSFIG